MPFALRTGLDSLSHSHAPNHLLAPTVLLLFSSSGSSKVPPASHPAHRPTASAPLGSTDGSTFHPLIEEKEQDHPVGQNEEEEVEKSFFPGFFTKFPENSALSNRQSAAHPAGHRRTMEFTSISNGKCPKMTSENFTHTQFSSFWSTTTRAGRESGAYGKTYLFGRDHTLF